jgi:hypothetical protein
MATKRENSESSAAGTAQLHPLQRFEPVTIHRREIKEAPYNPRRITDKARRQLRVSLEKNGLVEGLVWNARTGRLVGGHQRLGQLDAYFGSDNYLLTVCKNDVDDAQEINLNVALNNEAAQGEFVADPLRELLKRKDVDHEAMGYDTADVFTLFGGSVFASDKAGEQLEKLAERLRDTREAYDKIIQKSEGKREKNDDLYYLVVVFRNQTDRVDFAERLGLEEGRLYVSGRQMRDLMRIPENSKDAAE